MHSIECIVLLMALIYLTCGIVKLKPKLFVVWLTVILVRLIIMIINICFGFSSGIFLWIVVFSFYVELKEEEEEENE
uniref:Uncharacterized protein n=1 Tax=Strigamia maritima TaxID=126957 RepID=T1IH39_STRMM